MSWTSPVVPVSGTTITVAWASANIVDLLNWLRQMTGGADPGAANRVLISTGATATTWGQLPDVAMQTQKVSRIGDTMTGDLQVNRSGLGAATTGYLILGNDTAKYIGFDGTNHVTNTGTILTTGNAATVPSGLIAAFATAAAIASGWSRYTAADGRILIGAGTTFSQTFTENSNAGASSWAHQHGMTFESGTNNPAGGSVNSGAGSTAVPTHSHTVNGNTNDATWIPPVRVVVMAQKS